MAKAKQTAKKEPNRVLTSLYDEFYESQSIGRIVREPTPEPAVFEQAVPAMMSTKVFAENTTNKLAIMEKRIAELEKKIFGEYMHRRINNKTDGSNQFEEDVAMFFQLDMHLNSWKKIFKDLKISIDQEDIVKLANSYKLPVKK